MNDQELERTDYTLDEETSLRLLAISSMFRAEEGKVKTPETIIEESITRIHITLLKSKAAYAQIYKALADKRQRIRDEAASSPVEPVDYPDEFQDLETGIESVFLKRKYRCPMCENAFTAPALKTGSLLVKVDQRTQMEVYTGVRQDSEKEFVDFSLFHIMLCPKCLYASTEKEFDLWDAGAKNPQWIKRKHTKIPQKIYAAFHNNIERRMRLAQSAGDMGRRLFSTERTEEDAAISIDLASDTLEFLIGKVSINRKAELMYQLGMLNLLKSLQFEKQLEDPELSNSFQEIKKKRLDSIKEALKCFIKIPDSSVENFDVRENVRFNARKFWAAHELKHLESFAQAGASLQRTYNQFNNMVKKAEREFQLEEVKIGKLRADMNKAKNIQKKEQLANQVKEIEKNLQLIRSGLENYRGVVRVVNPIYDTISVIYDKFREMQRQRKRQAVG